MNKKDKLQWIRVKNAFRKYPECDLDGFYCDHIWDPEYPWQWVDFRFFHRTKKMYYAVAMTTLAYDMYGKIEDEQLNNIGYEKITSKNINEVMGIVRGKCLIELSQPIFSKENITTHDYGKVCTGVWATLNTPFIDANIIRGFIAFFQFLGEPTKAGFKWEGEEVEVNFEKFKTA